MTKPDPDPAQARACARADDAKIAIAPEFLPGVAANLALLEHYGALIHGLALPDHVVPAMEYVP